MRPTLIIRHRKENLGKCSLRGLEGRGDFIFLTYPKDPFPDLTGYVLLTLQAPLLTAADADYGIFLIDGTWRHSQTIFSQIPKPHRFSLRSLPPHLRTAYPRRQEDCPDAARGLASIEALFAAYEILGREREGEELLEHYHWKEAFLLKNRSIGNELEEAHIHMSGTPDTLVQCPRHVY